MFTAEEDEKDTEKRLNALMENLKMRAGQLRSSVEAAKLPQIDITVGHREHWLTSVSARLGLTLTCQTCLRPITWWFNDYKFTSESHMYDDWFIDQKFRLNLQILLWKYKSYMASINLSICFWFYDTAMRSAPFNWSLFLHVFSVYINNLKDGLKCTIVYWLCPMGQTSMGQLTGIDN